MKGKGKGRVQGGEKEGTKWQRGRGVEQPALLLASAAPVRSQAGAEVGADANSPPK